MTKKVQRDLHWSVSIAHREELIWILSEWNLFSKVQDFGLEGNRKEIFWKLEIIFSEQFPDMPKILYFSPILLFIINICVISITIIGPGDLVNHHPRIHAEPSRDFDHNHKLDRTVLCYGPSNANCYIQCGNRKLKCVQCLDTEMMHIELIASYEKWILNHDGNLYIL